MDKEFPCVCGHYKRKHYCNYLSCCANWANSSEENPKCMCEKFVPDNLRYLELLVVKNDSNTL